MVLACAGVTKNRFSKEGGMKRRNCTYGPVSVGYHVSTWFVNSSALVDAEAVVAALRNRIVAPYLLVSARQDGGGEKDSEAG